MKSITTIACLLLLSAAPALAQQDELDGDLGFAKDGFIREMNAGAWEGASIDPPIAGFWTELSNVAGPFKLYNGPLSAVHERLGGTRQVYDYLGYRHEWLCYVGGGQRVWYFEDDGSFDWVVAEPSNPKTDADYGCTEQPLAALTSASFPSIGATLDDLAKRFDWPLEPNTERVVFFGQVENEIYYTRTVYYRLKDGVVDGVSFAEGPGF